MPDLDCCYFVDRDCFYHVFFHGRDFLDGYHV